MVSARKWRFLLAAVAAALVMFVVFSRRHDYAPAAAEPAAVSDPKSLIESTNNDKVDAAINQAISKQKDGKAQKLDESVDDTEYDAAKDFLQIRSMGPMVVFSKLYCPFSKRLKQLLRDHYSITPEPTIVELDLHKHGKELQDYLRTLTNRGTVPNVLVGSKNHESRGGSDDFLQLHNDDKLADLLNLWGDKELSVKRIEVPSNL